MDKKAAFQQAIRKAGIGPPAEIIADGAIHRFHVEGDKSPSKNGWYVLHDGDPTAGAFGTWKGQGVWETWSSRDFRSLTAEEKAHYEVRMELIRKQREEEQARAHAECREWCADAWKKAEDASNEHIYLKTKCVKSYGLKIYKDSLMIPLQDLDGTLHGIQFIKPDGTKKYKSGTNKAGHFFKLGQSKDNTVILGEGYATGASIHEATGHAVVIAFDASNLLTVVNAIRAKYPEMKIIIAADDDKWIKGNPGLTKATAAAREVGALLAIPLFREDRTKPTDFNDLQQLEGLQAVKRFIDRAEPLPEPPEEKELKQSNNIIPLNNGREYFVDEAGNTCRLKKTQDGFVPIKLCNFEAWITKEISEDNGIEITHYFAIAGKIKDKLLPEIETTTKQFSSLSWLHCWGNEAIIEPGQNTKDYLRHAIQTESKGVSRITCFTHTGFREINGSPVYLTSGGGIGAENIIVKLSREMQKYCLPLKPENEIEAIKASLSFLDVAKRAITIPLFALLYMSPLTTLLEPMPNFSGYLFGETGSGKSTLAMLLLCHFGDFLSMSCLSNFEDTANNLEKKAFILKDAFMILDDYYPTIKRADSEKMESTAQRTIRSHSNRTGRGRLNSDSTDKGRYEPRGMLLITGEELVRLQSTIARLMILELCKGDIYFDRLTSLQQQAQLLPNAMTSYILWVIDNMADIKSTFKEQFPKLRQKAQGKNIHAKLPEQCAFLQFSINTVLSWMIDKNILTKSKAAAFASEAWDIFINLAHVQSRRIQSEDPIKTFGDIFNVMIEQKKIRLENKGGTCGSKVIGGGEGDLIGWYDDLYFYLLPKALWHALQSFCMREGTHYPVSERTFSYMLQKKGFIAEAGEESASKPVRIQGDLKRVIKIYRSKLLNEEKEQAYNEALSSA